MNVDLLCNLFLARCRAERLSPGTISFYDKYLRYLRQVHGADLAESITVHQLRAVLATHQDEGRLSPTTINHLVASWRAAFTWAFQEELLEVNPTARLKKVKVPQRQPETVSGETMKAILAVLPNDFSGIRDRTMLLILLDAGLRLAELMGLNLDDVDITHGLLTVVGKGDKQRQVPISPVTCTQIVRYLGHRARKVKTDREMALWISDRGGSPVHRDYLWHMLADLCEEHGLPHVYPHLFRHTCATEMLRAGANPMHVQLMLGHTSVTTTQRYIHLAGTDVAAMHQQASPVGRLLQERGKRRSSR